MTTSTDQLDWSTDELLADHDYAEPQIVGGVRCHGGYDDTGAYVSPRTRNRVPAIDAWQRAHRATFATDIIDVPLETWPEHYPNVPQARFLLDHGVRDPIIAVLTRIGTVEGFGGLIRYTSVPDLPSTFVEDTRSTALAHLERGLFEAHARDETGHEDEGGHTLMWWTARDIAFENPVTEDQTTLMLERMGISQPGTGGAIDPARLRAEAIANRILPADIDFDLESMLNRMIGLLFIEISAFHAFDWAQTILDDTDRVAGDGEAGSIIAHIRSDETPHVEYLKTVLTEIRDRTIVDEKGHEHRGADVVGPLWNRALENSLGVRRDAQLDAMRAEVAHAVQGRHDAGDLLAEFDALGSTERDARGHWAHRVGSLA
ncbi:MAG: hypothetical protein JST73_01165 [Actinobacteria bacterium]|nr:hypothetical protein [Actinomycetota bacterium]